MGISKQLRQREPHNKSEGRLLEEIILGGQDGLVNVLGIVLGVATATGDVRLVLIAGLAATFAESISMAAVAYTSTKAAGEYYESEKKREIKEMEEMPETEKEEIRKIFSDKGIKGKQLGQIVEIVCSNKQAWLDIMMTEELNLPPKKYKKPEEAAVVVGVSAFAGSIFPLAPFFFMQAQAGMVAALIISIITLFFAGTIKAKITGNSWKKSAFELTIVGISAAIAGYLIGAILGVTV